MARWRSPPAPTTITITSFNEWQEGTQIEPAAPPIRRGEYSYGSYDGAWGLVGHGCRNGISRPHRLLGEPVPRGPHTASRLTRSPILQPVAAAERTVSAPLAQLPNALTIARLVVIPVYAVLILTSTNGHSWAAAILFAAAGVTDQIDGCLARRWHVESAFGKIADPLADRLLIDVAVVLLWHAGRLPWAALAIPARDVLLIVVDAVRVRPRLPVRGQHPRQARDVAAVREPRARDGRARTTGRSGSSGRVRLAVVVARAVRPRKAPASDDRPRQEIGGAGNLYWILKLRLTVRGLVRCNQSTSTTKGQVELLPDLGSLSDEELKQLIVELTAREQRSSYERRILHGKIDILRAELVARLPEAAAGACSTRSTSTG